ncbi:MAG: anthranilate phosphoribosyltransferase [Candidatus Omnitrophota bacterium]|nr:MAG: anthranilate phosphoribosyltransferase [Candidatus Omnitrophota bacterium]
MIKEIIGKLVNREDLSEYEMERIMEEIMQGNLSPSQISAFLVALKMKGESAQEITAGARIMRKYALKINPERDVLDTCGTGGDGKGTFNISTACAIVVSACGVAVAKHGNRSISSKCGSADVLKALGIDIEMKKERAEECLRKIGITFLFAPLFHPAMKNVLPTRREIGIRTIFNILGPLVNPAGAKYQLLGVYDKTLGYTLAEALKNLGSLRCLLVHSADGLDELSTTDKNYLWEVNNGKISHYEIEPLDFGFSRSSIEDLLGGEVSRNAQIILEVFKGRRFPPRDVVVLNSGCALYTANKAKDIKEGIKMAKESIDSGKAMKKLEEWKRFSEQGC